MKHHSNSTFSKIIILLLCLSIGGCNSNKFNKKDWQSVGDLNNYPYRDAMLNDLVTNYKLKGIAYKELISLLGEPSKNLIGDSNEIIYPISIEYGSEIDPVSTVSLAFELNSDSTIREFKVLVSKK